MRAAGRSLKPAVQVGKSGITEALVMQVTRELRSRGLVKVRVLEACSLAAAEVGEQLAAGADAHLVACVGKTLLFYRDTAETVEPA